MLLGSGRHCALEFRLDDVNVLFCLVLLDLYFKGAEALFWHSLADMIFHLWRLLHCYYLERSICCNAGPKEDK